MKNTPTKIRIGTRGSSLALKQSDIVSDKIHSIHPQIEVEIVIIITTGDKILDRSLATIGGKGLFIKEIEEQLQNGKIDIAVHSLKDMQAIISDSFAVPCVLEREDSRDVLISNKYTSITELPKDTVIGTSSARRAAQLLFMNPDIKIVPLRGNINTRLNKLDTGIVDATFLAAAGLNRTGLMDKTKMHTISHDEMLPAVSQGAIGIEILENNIIMRELLKPLNHEASYICTSAERSFMRVFEGSCSTPIAALAEIIDNKLYLRCLIAKPDGTIIHRTSRTGNISDANNMGMDAAYELKKTAGENFFA